MRLPLPSQHQLGESAKELCITRAQAPTRPGMSSNSPQSPLSPSSVHQAARSLGSQSSEGSRRRPRVPNHPMRLNSLRLRLPAPLPPREQLEATSRSMTSSTCFFTVLLAASPSSLLALSNAFLMTTRTSLRSTTRAARAARRRQVAPSNAPARPTYNIPATHPAHPAPSQAPTKSPSVRLPLCRSSSRADLCSRTPSLSAPPRGTRLPLWHSAPSSPRSSARPEPDTWRRRHAATSPRLLQPGAFKAITPPRLSSSPASERSPRRLRTAARAWLFFVSSPPSSSG